MVPSKHLMTCLFPFFQEERLGTGGWGKRGDWMYTCRTFRETILPGGEDKWIALSQKPRKSGSGRCPEVGDVGVESNWWTSLGSQAGVLRAVSILSVKGLCPVLAGLLLGGV